MLVSELVERYLQYQKRHRKPATVRFYEQGLKWLQHFFSLEWDTLNRDQVVQQLDKANVDQHGNPWKPDTIRRNILCFDQLQKFGVDQYDLEVIVRPRDLKKPPGAKREAIPTEAEIEKLFTGAREHSEALELAFRSLAASGMRPNELAGAKISELNPNRDLLLIQDHKTRGKTGKAKRVALGPTLQSLVKTAVGDRSGGTIWLDETGKPWQVAKLSRLFRSQKIRLGLNNQLVLYSLRHWKGTQVARKHGIHAAMTILGHKQITTTQRYTHPSDDDAREWQE